MSDYDVGYGKPPKHSRFKKGVCPNPAGRGKRRELDGSEVMKRVLNASAEFRDRGKLKKATRIELTIRKLVATAVKGDVASAWGSSGVMSGRSGSGWCRLGWFRGRCRGPGRCGAAGLAG